MFISEYLGVSLKETGAFDALLDKDSHFFINIVRLKQTKAPELRQAYQHINDYFAKVATLLDAADSPDRSDKMYRAAGNLLCFHEAKGINLGFSNSSRGAGWGKSTTDQVLRDAYQIVKKGSRQPEIFHLVGLFEEGISSDRISDMIATIIESQIRQYTLRLLDDLGITPESRPNLVFNDDGLIMNPYKPGTPILILPEDVLHNLPIARDWYEVEDVIEKNKAIRREMNSCIGEAWAKWGGGRRKRYLKEHVFMNPQACARVIDDYRSMELEPYDLMLNPDYAAETLFREMREDASFSSKQTAPSSHDGMLEVLNMFKDWVENNRGWSLIQALPTKGREKAIQRLIHLSAKNYVEVNNFDLSFEPDEGRGPADIKLSRGRDKTLAEVKLTSNRSCKHGFEVQLQEYGKAEQTHSLIYVLVDVGHPKVTTTIRALHDFHRRQGDPCPELVVVDAQEKKAASTYEGMEGLMSEAELVSSFPALSDEFLERLSEETLPTFNEWLSQF